MLSTLGDFLRPFPHILSFASFGTEIETHSLNRLLAQREQLYLPKIVDNDLHIYHISDLDHQLAPNSLGIPEPIVERCEKLSPNQLSLILVPALGFDRHNHRIGYGKGFYDRLLYSLPHCPAYGIGFTEQLGDRLPCSKQDMSLDRLLLF